MMAAVQPSHSQIHKWSKHRPHAIGNGSTHCTLEDGIQTYHVSRCIAVEKSVTATYDASLGSTNVDLKVAMVLVGKTAPEAASAAESVAGPAT